MKNVNCVRNEVISMPEKWSFRPLSYFIKASQMRGADTDYVKDKGAWDNFCLQVKNRIAYNTFRINWSNFQFKPGTTYDVYLRAKASYHDLPTRVEKMFEFGVVGKRGTGDWVPYEEKPLPDCGKELWYKWNLTKNRWYVYKIGKIFPEENKTIYLTKLHKEMNSLFVDSAWLIEEGKDIWIPPFNWHKMDYNDSPWDKTSRFSISIDPTISKIVLLRQNIALPERWKDKGYLFLEGLFSDKVYLNGEELYKIKGGYLIPPSFINYGKENLLALEIYSNEERAIRPSVRVSLEDYSPLPTWVKEKGVKKVTLNNLEIIAKVQREKIKTNQLSRIDFVIIEKGKNNPALKPTVRCEEKNFPIAPAKETGYFTAYIGYTEPGKHKIEIGTEKKSKNITTTLTEIEVVNAPSRTNKFVFGSAWWDEFKLNPYVNSPEEIESYYQKAFKLMYDCGMNTLYMQHNAERCLRHMGSEPCFKDKIARLARKYGMGVIVSVYVDGDIWGNIGIPFEFDPRYVYEQYKEMVNSLQSMGMPVCAYAQGDEMSLAEIRHGLWYQRSILQDIDPKPTVHKYNYTLADSFKASGSKVVMVTRRPSWRMCKDADQAGVVLWHKVDITRKHHYDPYCPEAMRLKSYLAIAHGAKGIIYWCGISYRLFNFAPCTHTGTSFIDARANPTDFYKKIALEVGEKIKKLGVLLMSLKREDDIARSPDMMATVTTRGDDKDRYIFIVNEDLSSVRKVPIILEKDSFRKTPMFTDMMSGKKIPVGGEDFTFGTEIGPADMKVLKVKER